MSLLSFLIWSIEVCPLGLYLKISEVLLSFHCSETLLRSYHIYLPVFYLPFAKVLEKVAASQLQSHLELDNLYETLQSGFRPLHCTETALLRLVTDLLLSADSEFLTFLLLLDLSSAFVTITILSLSVFLSWALLSCFTLYLSDKQYFIILQRYKSPILPLLMMFLKVLFSVLCSVSSSFLWYYPVTIWVSNSVLCQWHTHTHTHQIQFHLTPHPLWPVI